MWKAAHIPKDGTLDENLKPVIEKIVSTYALNLDFSYEF
jgi:hypothetical protein